MARFPFCLSAAVALTLAASILAAPPPTRTVNVADTLWGTVVADPYRWLEDSLSEEVQLWTAAQNAHYQQYVRSYPGRDQIYNDLTKLYASGSVYAPLRRGQYLFLTKREGSANQPALFVKTGDKSPRLLIDPNTLTDDGTAAMDWWYPSDDGALIIYGISYSGSERSTLHVMRTADGSILPDTIPDARAASVACLPDNSGFYYTRFPAEGSVPPGDDQYYRRVYFHRMRTPFQDDSLIFSYDSVKTAWPAAQLSPNGRWLAIPIYITYDKTSILLRDRTVPGADWIEITPSLDRLYSIELLDDRFFVMTNEGAPQYRIFSGSYDRPQREHWREVITERPLSMQGFSVADGKLLVNSLRNAYAALELFTLDGAFVREIRLPAIGSVGSLNSFRDDHKVYMSFATFTYPTTILAYDIAKDSMAVLDQVNAGIDLSDFVVDQVWYKSADSTPISMFIVTPKAMPRDGSIPCYLTGYGGFNSPMTPYFSRGLAYLMSRGFSFAMPNLRGGGEYGDAWHKAGRRENRKNVYADFIAAAEYLIAEKYTSSDKLVMVGGSNGGLLVGQMLVSRPDLAAAIVCQVPLLDMVRFQYFRIARLWTNEYGSSEDSTEFQFLYPYSPYHHVKPGTAYPAVLFHAGESDGRVDPMHARKMGARVQAATSSDRPVLIYIESKAGHGQGKPLAMALADLADEYAFIFKALNLNL